MAVKGKKKTQRRGSQGRRRPSQAPRPAYAAPRRRSWYRTPAGVAAAIGVAVVAVGLVLWLVLSAQSDSRALQTRRASLDRYSGGVRALLQEVRSPASEMAAIARPEVPLELESSAPRWVTQLEAAQEIVESLDPAAGQDSSQRLYKEAVLLYLDAAKTYEFATTLRGASAAEAMTRAADQRNRATAVWDVATGLLETARSDAELASAGIGSPAGFAPGSQTQNAGPGEDQGGGSGGNDN